MPIYIAQQCLYSTAIINSGNLVAPHLGDWRVRRCPSQNSTQTTLSITTTTTLLALQYIIIILFVESFNPSNGLSSPSPAVHLPLFS